MNTPQSPLPNRKKTYRSSYFVYSENETCFSEMFRKIDSILSTSKSPILVAIDGPCASGKSTLAQLIAAQYICSLFHTDDFFLRPEQRTPERLSEVGGNMDRERLYKEILIPLKQKNPVLYRPYSCKTQTIADCINIPFCRLNIIEGVYSLHPTLRQFYDLKIALNISDTQQLQRLRHRETPENFKLFCERWIPLEKKYIEQTSLFESADMLYHI